MSASPDPATVESLEEQIKELSAEKTRLEGVVKSLKEHREKIIPSNTKTTKQYEALSTSVSKQEAELKRIKKTLAEVTKRKEALTKTAEPATTVAVKAETPITLDTIDKKIRETASKIAVLDAQIADVGTKKTKPGVNTAKFVAEEEELKERKEEAEALQTKLGTIKAYADVLKPFRKRTDDITKYKTLRTTFKQAEAAQKLKATVGTNRALQQAKQQYEAVVTELQRDATAIKTPRDVMEAADATFQETPEEKELYGLIKEIAEYKLPTAAAAATSATSAATSAASAAAAAPAIVAAPSSASAAAAAAASAAPVPTTAASATTSSSDTTDPSDITFTFLDQTFTVENDFAGEELKPKQKQFLTDMNILPLLEPVLQAPALLTILNNIVTKSTCKVDYGLSMLEECNPMRSMLSILQEAMWNALGSDSDVLSKIKPSSGPGSKSSTRTGSSGFTTITITLPMADLYAAME
jgi:myosin heavy subunit